MNMDPNALMQKLSGYFRYGPSLRPRRDWFALLAAAALLIVISAAVNLFLFLKVENGEALSDVSPAAVSSTVQISTLDAVQSIFAARASTAAAYQDDPHLADPSL